MPIESLPSDTPTSAATRVAADAITKKRRERDAKLEQLASKSDQKKKKLERMVSASLGMV